MARWLKGIEESAFKPVPGGYIFQSPNPWLFARPNYYLVNDAQKAALAECLRKRVRFAMLFSILSLVVVFAMVTALIWYFRQSPLPPFLMGMSAGILLLIPVMIVPHIYYMRMLGPIIKDLPKSDQRFTMSVQFSNLATAMPKWLLIVGMAGGAMAILGSMIGLYDLMSEGRLAGRWMGQAFSLTFGVLLAAYFAYLVILKRKQTKTTL